ncbi:MAG TPA: BtaA family protein [Rhodanobacteraceae bacterium]|nr:BtaA family protein [Rhodanobacteraceae bacterium]
MPRPSLRDKLDQKIFDAIYSRSLVYNTCWEDPAVDRQALALGPEDTVLVITSAGCNALDYAIAAPKRIHAVDANPRQNALLELKMAGIRALAFDEFFAIFGEGYHARFEEIYRRDLRPLLSTFAQSWWDRHRRWFTSPRGSFYFHGLSGIVARAARAYFASRPRLSEAMADLFDARDLAEQQAIYDERVAPLLWNKAVDWAISRQLTMSLLGVPHPQRKLVEAQHAGGVAGFIRSCVQYVFRQLPLGDNYFWRVYVTGRYRRDCCPEYLKRENFERLKGGLVDRIALHTATVTEFLLSHDASISRFVLLDHMDWMSSYDADALTEEWEAIRLRAAPRARILLRSAHARPAYLESIRMGPDGDLLRDVFRFMDDVADALQPHDRVHTYAGFVIADAPA